jgi:flagellar hook-associated protein 1 FlgK
MSTVQTQTGQNVTVTIDEINSIGSRIASLNTSIVAANQTGDKANDLLDERDVLLDRLAELGNVSWTNQADGSIDVTMGGGVLVTGQVPSTLVEAGFTSLTSGKLKALIDLRDTTIPAYQSQLNSIAKALADKVNAQHALGYDLATGAAGGQFFTYTAGSEASTLAVSAAISANPNLVAASSAAPATAGAQAGNGGNAIKLAQLATDPAIDAAYKKLVTTIGTDTQEARRSLDSARILSDSLENRRASLSGVSLDEEMTNMVKFQRGYQAAARALNAMDEMVELLITRTGRVGI